MTLSAPGRPSKTPHPQGPSEASKQIYCSTDYRALVDQAGCVRAFHITLETEQRALFSGRLPETRHYLQDSTTAHPS